MRKIIKYNSRNRKKIDKLPKIYLIGCWARWGAMEFPFAKFDKDKNPLVYNYNDHNGTADQWELIPLEHTTTGIIYDWTFSKESAEKIAGLLNKRDGLNVD